MLTLNLGEIDVLYGDAEAGKPKRVAKARKGKQRPRKTKGSTPNRTTGDVAKIIEAKYGLFSDFYESHKDEIAGDLAESMAGAIDNLVAGAPASALATPFQAAQEKIKERFQEYLDREEMGGRLDGVPTKAALKGVSHRFKHPYAKGHPRRPSFVDTGMMREAFIAWLEGELAHGR